MINPNKLAFTGEKDALIFFDAAAGGARLKSSMARARCPF